MIIKKLFTYWEGNQFSILNYYSLYSISKYNPDLDIIIYTSNIESNKLVEWTTEEHSIKITNTLNLIDMINRISELNNNIKIIKIDFENEYNINNSLSCVHKADIVRIIKLYEHGGIWFDLDILFLKPIPKFFFEGTTELFLFSHWNTIPTGFIASTPKNKLITLIYNGLINYCKNNKLYNYQILGPNIWNYFYKNFGLNDKNIIILENEYIYPYDWITIKYFFYSNDDSYIKNNTFGIHWYNGWTETKKYINNLDIDNITPKRNVCEKIIYNLNNKIFDKINTENIEYNNTQPYPHYFQDNFLDIEFAKKLQEEIINIPLDHWDRYENPFEKKYTLRDKFNFTPLLKDLFYKLTEEKFIKELSEIVGYELLLDTTRNFWGVHTYSMGDKLDIHVDAGLHPTLGLKKQITLGIYLSYEWKEEYGCELEIWKGDNSSSPNAKIYKKISSISPLFNRMIIFTCNDYSWHGNPNPSNGQENSKRIFITISYLSKNYEDLNKKVKAFFVARPDDPLDLEKDELRLLRADSEKYKEIYRI